MEKVSLRKEEDCLIVSFNLKELSKIEQSEELLEVIVDRLVEDNPKYMILDFSNVNFISTMAINMLLVLLKRMRFRGGDLGVCGVNDQIAQLFKLMQLDRLFSTYGSVEEAIEGIRKEHPQV